MTSATRPNQVEPLLAVMATAATVGSAESYDELMAYLSHTRGQGIRHLVNTHDVVRFTEYMNALNFHQPPCDLRAWLTCWQRFTDYMIDAGIDDLFDSPGSHAWHILFLPALAARIGGTAVFSDNDGEKAMARARCRELGLRWLDCVKMLKDKPVLILEHLRFMIVSDAEEDVSMHFPAWNILLGCPGQADTSQWLLSQLLPTIADDVSRVCLLEPRHQERVSMLINHLSHKFYTPVEPPSDFNLP